MSTALAVVKDETAITVTQDDSIIREVALRGNLAALNDEELWSYYQSYCRYVGLDPITKPFDLLEQDVKGKGRQLTLYPNARCSAQLTRQNQLSFSEPKVEMNEMLGLAIVRVEARLPNGASRWGDSCIAYKGMEQWKMENAYKKAVTQAHRRAVLGLCGLAGPDESEVEDIPNARPVVYEQPRQLNEKPQVETPTASLSTGDEVGVGAGSMELTDTKTANEIVALWPKYGTKDSKTGKSYALKEYLAKNRLSGLASLPAERGAKLLAELKKREALARPVDVNGAAEESPAAMALNVQAPLNREAEREAITAEQDLRIGESEVAEILQRHPALQAAIEMAKDAKIKSAEIAAELDARYPGKDTNELTDDEAATFAAHLTQWAAAVSPK